MVELADPSDPFQLKQVYDSLLSCDMPFIIDFMVCICFQINNDIFVDGYYYWVFLHYEGSDLLVQDMSLSSLCSLTKVKHSMILLIRYCHHSVNC